MIATIARPTTVQAAIDEPATDAPSVTYDLVNRKAWARVIVTHAEGAANAEIAAPPISAPKHGVWIVAWTLVPGPGVHSATFRNQPNEKGITVPATLNTLAVPPGVNAVESKPVTDEPTKWRVTFKNEVSGVNWFSYGIAVDWHSQQPLPGVAPRTLTVHDPTIVVATDPIDG